MYTLHHHFCTPSLVHLFGMENGIYVTNRNSFLSDVVSGVEATGQSDVAELTRDMFSKMTEYLRGDLASTAEDYKLLEQMNKLTTEKYGEMKQMGLDIGRSMKDLNDKYRNIQPYLDQIDQVEESVANLEQAALRLEAYSKRLEAKFKQLEKK